MKHNFIVLILISFSVTNIIAQTKKEQILILQNQLDSLELGIKLKESEIEAYVSYNQRLQDSLEIKIENVNQLSSNKDLIILDQNKLIDSLNRLLTIKRSDLHLRISSMEDYESFDSFYYRFIEDSIFQKNRIKFPIEGGIYEMGEEPILWNRNNWSILTYSIANVDLNTYSISVTNWDPIVLVKIYINESGVSNDMIYEKINNKWYLVKDELHL